MPNNDKMLLNMRELQAALGVGRTLAYKIAQDRNFPKMTINGRYYFPVHKVEQWIERNQGKDISV